MPKVRKPSNIYIGIDPGVKGGITFLCGGDLVPYQMPKTEQDIWHIIDRAECAGDPKAVIEKITPAIFGISKAAMSKLYGSYMSLRMCLIVADIPFDEVAPKEWQKAMHVKPKKKGMTTDAWKTQLAGRARELFPSLEVWRQKKEIQLAVADSILLVEYCRRLHEGKL